VNFNKCAFLLLLTHQSKQLQMTAHRNFISGLELLT
jgi:hypothetical protein